MNSKTVIAVIAIVIAMSMFAGCGKDSQKGSAADARNAQPASSAEQPAKAAAPAKPEEPADPAKVKIDKTVKVGELEYTIEYSRTLEKGKNFAPRQSGNIFVIIGLSVKNTGSETYTTQYGGALFTSLFTLRDKDHKPDLGYDVAGGTGDTSGRFDTLKEIGADETVSGEIQYEVSPKNSSFLLELSGEKDSVAPAEIEIPVAAEK